MITDFILYGALDLEWLAMTGKADPYDVIDELARRIRNRRCERRTENPLAIEAYNRLSGWLDYKPMRADRR
ncbi:hypothetical protein [Endozoicomonas sp.]|uniref:hypothetical protein n=1 Tax=Endozoicomonas sp. TaxID=1892382 RepID=UPI00383B36A9